MKATELMIGNWVYLPDMATGKEYPARLDENFIYDAKYAEPIPLTTEILEKNGFYFGYTSSEEDCSNIGGISTDFEKGWCWDEGSGEIKIYFPNESDGGMIYIDDQSFNRHLEFVFCDTLYVHELQNVLILCKIDKQIEL